MTGAALAFQGNIDRPDLAALLDATGEAARLSPRSLLGPAALSPPRVSAMFADAARVMVAPRTNLTLRLWSGEEACAEMNVLFPNLPAGGRGVVLNPVGQGFQVGGFVDPEKILALLAPMLPAEPAARPQAFEAQLDRTTMAVLAACLDLLCAGILEERVARVLDKRPLPARMLDDAAPLARGHIAAYLENMWGLSRLTQFITYVLPISLMARPPSAADIDRALDRLREAGLIEERRADRFTATALLEPVVRAGLGASAGFQWQRVSEVAPDVLLVVERLFVVGGEGVVFAFSPTPEGLLHLALCTRVDISEFLVSELSEVAVPAVPPAHVPQTREKPAVPQTPAPAGNAKFCGQCGTPLQADWKFCGSCGATVEVPA